MLTDNAESGLEEFSGTLERIVYHNEENGWTVFRLRMEEREDPVSVVGSMGSPQPGVRLRLKGRWISHPKFGRQIQMASWIEERPATSGTSGTGLPTETGLHRPELGQRAATGDFHNSLS